MKVRKLNNSIQAYFEGLAGHCSGGLHHAVSYTQPVGVLHERRHQGDVLGAAPRLQQRQRPTLRVTPDIIQDQVEP